MDGALFAACVRLVSVAMTECRCVQRHALEQAGHNEAVFALIVCRCINCLLSLLTLLLLMSLDENLIHVFDELVFD